MVFRLVPRACTVAIMAIDMPAAIRPYSMAVAPAFISLEAERIK